MEPISESALGRVRRMLSPKRKVEEKRVLIIKDDDTVTTDDASEYSCSRSCCGTANSMELQSVFNYFDEDRDGKISAAELRSCVKTVGGELSVEEAEAAVKSSDLNGDGLLDYHEFHKLMEESSGSDQEEEKRIELKQAFGIYDVEGSGCITPASLKRMLSRLGESRSLKDCKAMIRAFDLNGDGVLSFDEFLVMMR